MNLQMKATAIPRARRVQADLTFRTTFCSCGDATFIMLLLDISFSIRPKVAVPFFPGSNPALLRHIHSRAVGSLPNPRHTTVSYRKGADGGVPGCTVDLQGLLGSASAYSWNLSKASTLS